MSLVSLIAVLLIEQLKPLPYRTMVFAPLARFARALEERFNAGEHSHGIIAWLAGVGGLVLLSAGTHALLDTWNPLLAWCWNVLVLYLQERFGWRAGWVQLGLDAAILLSSLVVVAPSIVALSLLGALALNLTLAVNHRPGRYMAV